jgi:hypothetical protein
LRHFGARWFKAPIVEKEVTICQRIAYSSAGESGTEMCVFSKIAAHKKIKNIHHHGLTPPLIIGYLPDPPHFSFVTTFK